MADFDVQGARKAGYSDDEILAHLTDSRKYDVEGALKEGHSKPEIIQYLSSNPPKSSTLDTIKEFGKGLILDPIKGMAEMAARATPNVESVKKGAEAVKRFRQAPTTIERMRALAEAAGHGIESAVPAVGLARGAITSQYETGKKAFESAQKGRYGEAAGYGLAAAIPIVGPGAAAAAETMGGTEAEYDKFGNVTRPAVPANVARGVGQGLSLIGGLAIPSVMRSRAAAQDAAIVNKYGPPPGGPPPPLGGPGGAPPARAGGLFGSQLNPRQQAAVDFLESQDVPLDAGTRTGNRFLKSAQKLVADQPMGAGTAAGARRATEQGLQRVSGELADVIQPFPESPQSAGAATRRALGTRIENLAAQAETGYEQAWAARGDRAHTYELPLRVATDGSPVMGQVNMPVDVRDIKYLAQPLFDEMQWMPASDRAASAGYQALKNILEGDDFIPAWQAERGLSGLKTMARVENKSGVRNTSQGIGASLIPELQANIDATVANTGQDAIRGLQSGRALHASKMELADIAEELRAEPVQAFRQTLWRDDTGIGFLRQIGASAPEVLPRIGRAYVQDLFDGAMERGGFGRGEGLLKDWEKLGPDTKAALFPDAELRSNLDKFFQGVQMVSENPNPSGTASVGQLIPAGLLMIHNPLSGTAYLLGGLAASKLLFSPRGVKLLTGSLRPQSPGAAAMTATQLMRIAGQRPPGGAPPPPVPGAGPPPPPPGPTPGIRQVPPAKPGSGAGLWERVRDFLQDEEGQFPSKRWKMGTQLREIQPFTKAKGEPKFTQPEVMRYIEDQVRRHQGALDPNASPSAKFNRIMRYARRELEDQMQQPEPNLDFYRVDTGVADADMQQAYPELTKDPVKMTIQKAISAALSPGQNPRQEAYYGGRVYGEYRETSRIPVRQPNGKFWPSQGASKAMLKIQGFLDKLGERELVQVLTGKYPVQELRQLNPSIGGKAADIVPGSLILGPKVGRYLNDLLGIRQEGSVSDVWDTRANQRRLGTMFRESGKAIEAPLNETDRQIFMDSHAKLGEEFGLTRNQAQSGLWHYEQDLYRRLGLPVKSFKRSEGTSKLLESLDIKRGAR